MYDFPAELVRVIDADTVELLGRCRLPRLHERAVPAGGCQRAGDGSGGRAAGSDLAHDVFGWQGASGHELQVEARTGKIWQVALRASVVYMPLMIESEIA